MKFRIQIEQHENGLYVATCPSLPGCVSLGGARAEAVKNVAEAMQGYVESLDRHGEPVPMG